MMGLLQEGPLGACVGTTDAWQHYISGVLPSSLCADQKTPNHCVQIVKLDVEGRWYQLKNSWGEDWGEEGFIRLPILENACVISSEPHSANGTL